MSIVKTKETFISRNHNHPAGERENTIAELRIHLRQIYIAYDARDMTNFIAHELLTLF